MGLLDTLIRKVIKIDGVELKERRTWNLIGATGADNPVTGETDVTFAGGGAGNDGKTVKAMANADQTLSSGEALKGIIEATGTLTNRRALRLPPPSGAGLSYHRTVQNSCAVHPISVGTDAGRTVSIPPGCTSIVVFDENGAKEVHGKVYDPRDFGCPWDGIHDDLPGLEAMMAVIMATKNSEGLFDHTPAHIQLPRGKGYCSDNWNISHPVHVVGHGWGADDALSELENGLKFAPLKGIIVHSYYTQADYPDGMAGEGSYFRDISLISTQAVMTDPDSGTSRGRRSLDKDLDTRSSSTYYPKGICVLADGTSSSHGPAYLCEGATRTSSGGPLVMFRVTTAGTTSGGATPASFATKTVADIGDNITDGSVTWTVESIPKDYENDTAYVVGQRVFLPGDPSCYFECVEAGTSIPFTEFGGTVGPDSGSGAGIGVSCSRDMLIVNYGGLFYDDGDPVEAHAPGLKWATYIPAGILFVAGVCTVDHCNISGFTGAGVFITDNINAAVFHGIATADGNHVAVRNCEILFCGGGIKVFGGNSNGCIFDWINLDFLGLGRTDVDAPAYLDEADPRWGTGAYCVWDASLGGASVRHIYGQAFNGCPFRNDRVTAAGSSSIWLFCLAEVVPKSYFLSSPVVIQVFPTSDANQAVVIGAECSGFHFADRTGTLMSAQISGGGQLYQFSVDLDLAYIWGWVHDGTDWGLRYGAAQPHALTLFGTQRGTDPGLGWAGFKRGFLVGDADGLMFRGPLASTGRTYGRLIDTNLRGGIRRQGDRFDGSDTAITITSEGWRGYPWQANEVVSIANETYGNPASVREPIANGDLPGPGRKVFQCTVAGTTDSMTEPNWSTAVAINDTVSDNGVEWTLVGFTPSFVKEIVATEATPDDTPVYIDLVTLDIGDVAEIDVIAKVSKDDGTVRQTFKLSALFWCDTGPVATLDGGSLTDASPRGTGTAICELDVSAGTVRLKITGIAATDLLTTYEANVI